MKSNMDDIVEHLTYCGLTANDAAVYLHLYQQGALNPSKISRSTGIQRPRVYDSLKRLMKKEYVVQNLDDKRAQYLVTNSNLILEDIQTQINSLMEAGQSLREFYKRGGPSSHKVQGVFQYNSDRPLRVALLEALHAAEKKITLMFGGSIDLTDEPLISTKLLGRKALEGVEVILLLFVDKKNWKTCVELQRQKVQIYHYPEINTETMTHLIDDHLLGISTIRIRRVKHQDRIRILEGLLYRHLPQTLQTHQRLLTAFQANSVPCQDRVDALEKTPDDSPETPLWSGLSE